MTMTELENFIEIVHLDDHEEADELLVTAHKVVECLGKAQSAWKNMRPQLSVNEFVEYFCDENVNPNCERIRQFVEKQSNWLLLQNALKIFDVVDVDKVECTHSLSAVAVYGVHMVWCNVVCGVVVCHCAQSGSIEYDEFTVFCKLIGEEDRGHIEELWRKIDDDGNGQIVIHELFGWYRQRLIKGQQEMMDNPTSGQTPQ